MKARIVNCPHCGTGVVWDTANYWRPFCSERCKMVDLGAWASESYRIPVVEAPDEIEDESGTYNPPLN
jgi:endogenous inhibitor of DNA gyrase (YacG/DUF329 family)